MKDILLDIVTHTHPLGRLPDLKIETDDEGIVQILSVDEKKTLILMAKTHAGVAGWNSSKFGFTHLEKLNLLLKNPEYEKDAIVTLREGMRKGEMTKTHFNFVNANGDFKNDFRLMSPDVVDKKVKDTALKGDPKFAFEFAPTMAAIARLKLMAAVHNEEPFVTLSVRETDGIYDLYFTWGDEDTHTGEYVFQNNVGARLSSELMYPVEDIQKILALQGNCTMKVTDGLLGFEVDSGMTAYNFYLPAQDK